MSYEQIARQQLAKEQINKQTQTVYEDYKKIKGFKDVGYLLEDYVVSGGEVTKDLARNDTVHVAKIVASLNDNMLSREGHTFSVGVPNTTYYLDFNKDGDWRWGLSREGVAGEDYISVASVTTNSSGLVQTITDLRGPVGGTRFKDDFGLEQYAKNQYVDQQIEDVNAQLADYPTLRTSSAVGDGIADDAAAIQNFIDLHAGQTIVFPAGFSYLISSTITIPDHTTIHAYGAKIFNRFEHMTLLELGNNVQIHGLEVEGVGYTTVNSSARAISIKGVVGYKQNITLNDCIINNVAFYGVYMEYAENVKITNCKIKGIGYGGVLGLSVRNVTVDKTLVKDITGSINAYGIAFTRDSVSDDLVLYPRSENCTASSCRIENIPWEALDTHAGKNIKFLDNDIINCRVGIAMVGAAETLAPIDCVARGNNIHGLGTGAGIVVAGAANLLGNPSQYAQNCRVENNNLIDCGEEGNGVNGAIYLVCTQNLSVIGNTLKNCWGRGIQLYNTNNGFAVVGNTIVDVRTNTLAAADAIRIASEFNQGVISGNSLLRVDATLATQVMNRGIRLETQNNNSITIGPHTNTALTKQSGLVGSAVSYGLIGSTANIYANSGNPEGVLVAPLGSLCINILAGTGTTLYVKETGSGNTGWVAK